MVFDIQTHETDKEYPFRLFENEYIFTPDHCHAEIEIIYVMKNEMDININGIKYHLSTDDIMVATSGDIHGIAYSDNRRLVIQFKLDILQELYSFSNDIKYIFEKLHSISRVSTKWGEQSRKQVKEIILGLKHAEENLSGTEYRLRVYSLLYQLIDIFINDIPEDEEQKQKTQVLQNKKIFGKIEKLFVYVHDNYDKNLTLEEISTTFHYSSNYFTKLWKKYIGVSFHKYLNDYRITRAMALLKESDLLVADIAYKMGFQSIKSFNRVFKSVTGMTPTEYKKSNR